MRRLAVGQHALQLRLQLLRVKHDADTPHGGLRISHDAHDAEAP